MVTSTATILALNDAGGGAVHSIKSGSLFNVCTEAITLLGQHGDAQFKSKWAIFYFRM